MALSNYLKDFQVLASLSILSNLNVLNAVMAPPPPPVLTCSPKTLSLVTVRSIILNKTMTASKTLKESLK